jgi:hypothetical protein
MKSRDLRDLAMNKSWMSGDKSSEGIEKLRAQIAQLEARRDDLLEKNKRKVFDWGWYVLNSVKAPKNLDELRNDAVSQEAKEVIAVYEQLNQEILEKESLLGEKLDEQARYDSLG